jgi:hypothetical protein
MRQTSIKLTLSKRGKAVYAREQRAHSCLCVYTSTSTACVRALSLPDALGAGKVETNNNALYAWRILVVFYSCTSRPSPVPGLRGKLPITGHGRAM